MMSEDRGVTQSEIDALYEAAGYLESMGLFAEADSVRRIAAKLHHVPVKEADAFCVECGGKPGDHADECTKGDLAIQVCEHHMSMGCIACGGPDPDCDCDEAGEG